jgi:hypothetical protein
MIIQGKKQVILKMKTQMFHYIPESKLIWYNLEKWTKFY